MLGTAEALSAGVTTVHNWAHNVRSPDHADAELSAMRDTGIRGRFAYGPAQGMPDDQPMDFAGMARVKRDWMPGDGLLTLGICSRNVGAMSIGGAARGVLTIEHDEDGTGSGARELGTADHAAHLRPEPDQAARGGRAARPRPAARASAAHDARGARDPEGARRELRDGAGRRSAPSVEPRRHPTGRAAGGGRQGQPVDRPHDQLQLRSRSSACASCSRCISTASATRFPSR